MDPEKGITIEITSIELKQKNSTYFTSQQSSSNRQALDSVKTPNIQ